MVVVWMMKLDQMMIEMKMQSQFIVTHLKFMKMSSINITNVNSNSMNIIDFIVP